MCFKQKDVFLIQTRTCSTKYKSIDDAKVIDLYNKNKIHCCNLTVTVKPLFNMILAIISKSS